MSVVSAGFHSMSSSKVLIMKIITGNLRSPSINKLLAICCLSAVGVLAACQPSSQTEKASKKVDKAIENVEQKIEQTSDSAEKNMQAAKKSVERQTEKAGDSLSASAEASERELEKAGKQLDQAINHTEKHIDKVKDAVTDSSSTAGEYIDDSVITTKIKAALLNDDFLKMSPIEVTTIKGEVKLTGTVDSEQLVARAIGLVNSQEHVKSVVNELMIKANVPSKQ
jgi:hyperosmotically inducible protein